MGFDLDDRDAEWRQQVRDYMDRAHKAERERDDYAEALFQVRDLARELRLAADERPQLDGELSALGHLEDRIETIVSDALARHESPPSR